MKKVIIITGASKGIGAACARLFLKKNYLVALLGRNKKKLTEVKSSNHNALLIQCDITKETEIIQAFQLVLEKWGRLDILFNNAGMSLPETRIDQINIAEWKNLIDVNLTGSFICAREAFRIMSKQNPQGGRIINNGSVSAKVPRYGTAAYTSSKHAITGLTKAIALDGRALNIACSQIDIGNANTNMVKKINADLKKNHEKNSIESTEEPTMDVKYVAKSVLHIAEMPIEANVQFMTLLANKMPFIGRG